MDQAAARAYDQHPQSGTVTKCKGRDCASSEHRIFRETRDGKFFQASKEAARDSGLSWGARGLHSYLQSLHQHSKITVKRLIELHGAGRDATRAYLKELRAKKYINQKCVRVGGQFEYEITVYGSPDLNDEDSRNNRGRKSVDGGVFDGAPSTAQPETEIPCTGKPGTENRIPETRPVKDIDQQLKIEISEDQRSAVFECDLDNQSRETTHTESATHGPAADAIPVEPVVCVPIPNFDLIQIRREYGEAHLTQTFPVRRKGIDNLAGWLVRAKDGRYDDDLVLPWWREQQEQKQQRAAKLARAEAEWNEYQQREAEEQRKAEALRGQQAEEEARRAEEWERNAPHREAARLEQQRQESLNRVAQAIQLSKHSASNPELYTGMIKNVLAGDETATRLFDEWLAEQSNNQASNAAA